MVDIKLIHGFFVNNSPNGRTARVLAAVVFCGNHGFNFIFHGVGQLVPVCEKNLMPLSSNGLCEAEITAPALACSLEVKYETAGVGITPKRCALPPAEQIPAASAAPAWYRKGVYRAR